jgi:hypothetical protein
MGRTAYLRFHECLYVSQHGVAFLKGGKSTHE